MVDKSQQQAAQEASLPPEQAAQGDSPTPQASEELSALVSDEAKELAQQAADEGSPTSEPEETLEEGPPIQNLIGEMTRKLDKVIQENEMLRMQMQNNQVQQQQTSPINNQPVPKAVQGKFGDIIIGELEEMVKQGKINADDYFAIERFKINRLQELNQEFSAKQNRVQSERQVSESRAIKKAKDMGFDIQSQTDPLRTMAINEMRRRASTIGMTEKEYYETFPFAWEDAVNSISGTVSAKQTPSKTREIRNAQLPVSDVLTARRKPVEKEPQPTEADVVFSKRYGSDFKTVSAIQKSVQNPKTFEVTVPIELD